MIATAVKKILASAKLSDMAQLPADKANHFVYGAAGAALGAMVLLVVGHHVAGLSLHRVALAAVGCSLLLGLWKERKDSKDPEHHTAEWADVRFTVFGGMAVVAPLAVAGVFR